MMIDAEVGKAVSRVREVAKEMVSLSQDAMFTETVAWLVICAIHAEKLTEEELGYVERVAERVKDTIDAQDHADDEARASRGN